MATLLTIVKGLNTGLLAVDVAGPLIESMLMRGAEAQTPVTDQDLKASSVSLGMELDELHTAIEEKIRRDAGKSA